MTRRGPVAIALMLLVGTAGDAFADPEPRDAADGSISAGHGLRERFGIDVARGLLRGGDASEEPTFRADVLRGIERAAATPDGVAELVKLLHEPHGVARADAKILLAATRALAPFAAQHAVAHALAEAVLAAGGGPPPRGAPTEDPAAQPRSRDEARKARVELARETAALALAQAGSADATELLLASARRAGAGGVAAARALAAFPPLITSPTPVFTPEALALAATLGDVRALASMREASTSSERAVRVAGLRGLGALGDARGVAAAEAAATDPDPVVREAATGALVDLGAPGAARAVRRLIEDDASVARGLELSTRVAGPEVVGALAARLRVSADLPLRRATAAALGQQDDPQALGVLADLLADPVLAGDAAEAIARSPCALGWSTIRGALDRPPLRRLGARMAALRGRLPGRGTVPGEVLRVLGELARSADRLDRQTGVAALILLGEREARTFVEDADAGVRRAAAMAAEPTRARDANALVTQLARETDPMTRVVLLRGLAARDAPDMTSRALVELARGGGVAAPLAALGLARLAGGARAPGDEDRTLRDAVDEALHSADPILRAHAARGLAEPGGAWRTGRLAEAYEEEVDPGTRRAIVAALAERTDDADVPLRAFVLERAARFDPEPGVRTIAARARDGLPVPGLPAEDGVVWLRVMTATGSPPPAPLVQAVVVRADGLALPVIFDEDGYALVPSPRGMGGVRLVLAPRL
jgi:hypothetical protein